MPRTNYSRPGVYNANPLSLADGEGVALATDQAGRLIGGGGAAADNAPKSGNPTLSGAVYNSSTQTYANGDVADNQADINGNLKVTEATLLAGEDLTINRLLNNPKLTYSPVAVADVQIKGSPGILGTVTFSCNDAAPTAGSIIIYDSLTETGTVVFNHTFTTTPFVPFTVTFNYNMLTGIYVGCTTTGDVNFSVGYI